MKIVVLIQSLGRMDLAVMQNTPPLYTLFINGSLVILRILKCLHLAKEVATRKQLIKMSPCVYFQGITII